MACISRRTFVGALPFVATGLSTLVSAEVATPSAATLFQNVKGCRSHVRSPPGTLLPIRYVRFDGLYRG